jgi:hypothetical protein
VNFWNKNESILFSYMCVMGIYELLIYYLNSTMTTESKIPNNTCNISMLTGKKIWSYWQHCIAMSPAKVHLVPVGVRSLMKFHCILESKIPNNTCSHPNIQNDLYYQVMSRRITYDYCDYLRNIIQKHKTLIWLVTYLHVLLIIKRNIKIQISGIEMILLW